MNPMLQSIANMALKSPAMQEALASVNNFVSTLEARLTAIEQKQNAILEKLNDKR